MYSQPRTLFALIRFSLVVAVLFAATSTASLASSLDVNTSSNFTGTYGLQVDLSSGGVAYVEDQSPANESRYRVRFYVDPSSLTGCSGDCSVSIFEAYSSNGGKPFDVRLRKQASGFFVQFNVADTGGAFNPKWAIDEKGWAAIEIDWQAASTTVASDGAIDFWIDGTPRSGFTNIAWGADNDIDYVRLGNPGVNTFGTGSVDIDDFESRRNAFIGIITDQPLAPPALVAPSGSITDTTPTLTWNAVPGATAYQVYVYNLTTSTFIASPVVTGTTYTTVGLNQNHDYRWRVRSQSDGGFGPSSPWTNFTYGPSSPPPIPSTIAPQGTITDPTPTFTWNAANGADRYQIYIQDLDTGQFVDTTSTITTTSYTSAALDTNHAYRWRLRAYNSAGWSGLSAWRNFDYVSGPPPTPSQIGPQGSQGTNPPTFTWTSSNTNRYQIYIQNISLGQFVDTTSTIPGTSYTPAALDNNYSYRWRVRAYNSAGWSNVGAWMNFDFFTSPPATPTPVAPNGATTSPPTYTWNAVSQATRYQIYVQQTFGSNSIVESPSLLTGTSYQGVALPSGTYRWRIRAYNPAGWSSTSSWVNFSIP